MYRACWGSLAELNSGDASRGGSDEGNEGEQPLHVDDWMELKNCGVLSCGCCCRRSCECWMMVLFNLGDVEEVIYHSLGNYAPIPCAPDNCSCTAIGCCNRLTRTITAAKPSFQYTVRGVRRAGFDHRSRVDV